MQNLPDKLYSVDSVVQLEQVAIKQFSIPAYELMKRAGKAVFNVAQSRYPQYKKMLVICGAGNNAGDGYVVAKLAKEAGFDVRLISLIDPSSLKNEAQLAYQDWLQAGTNETPAQPLIDDAEIIIDALLGTGLARAVSDEWAKWIDSINCSGKAVISVDVPSGLNANTGAISGIAVNADVTVSFIGLKQGMFTAQAKDVCGEIVFDDLALPAEVYSEVDADAQLINSVDYSLLTKRKASSNKGCFGHVLIAGGNDGMPGAVILAAKAALRTGAGLLTIIAVPQNLVAISSAVPEAMVKCCEINSLPDLFSEKFIDKITHVAVGMGLGQDAWSLQLLQHCIKLNKPMLIDADALNLIATHKLTVSAPVVITPHPVEAARLLSASDDHDTTVQNTPVQLNRFLAIEQLHDLFTGSESCTVILKGSGTLIYNGQLKKICNRGSAAMAAPGLGDVLSGIVIALMAQKIEADNAAELAVCLHACAAERVVKDKTRGLLASDVVNAIAELVQ